MPRLRRKPIRIFRAPFWATPLLDCRGKQGLAIDLGAEGSQNGDAGNRSCQPPEAPGISHLLHKRLRPFHDGLTDMLAYAGEVIDSVGYQGYQRL